MAARLTPDVVLMDINMPDMDGIAATEQLSSRRPAAAVVMMSVQGEADYLRRSMLAGAREFLVKPFSSDELTASIRQVTPASATSRAGSPSRRGHGRRRRRHVRDGEPGEPGLVVAVFSPKGGVGRTTVAVNLAVAAATELGKKVVIVDGSFQFGDVGVLLNLNPKNKSIADLDPRARGRRGRVDRHLRDQPLGRHPRPAGPAVARDGRADHAERRQAGHRGAARGPRPRRRGLHRRTSTTRRWPSSTRPM